MVVIPLQNEQEAKRKRFLSDVDRVAQVISRRQEQEEENNPFFERRQKKYGGNSGRSLFAGRGGIVG